MENPEGVLNLLDEFAKIKSKEIPNDLEEYLLYVAASGDPVYQWSLIKSLYRQKLINVITEFYETCPMMDIPPCPNVEPFNYETLKNGLLDRLDSFSSAPFTIQRISELLTNPRKQYNRVDKFMRAIEKNIWVVSTREPGQREAVTQENSSNLVNGVAPRVHVTVKHPKRGKSIEERIKSGHPQLIDDDDEEEEDEEQMEVENNAELIANNETDDAPLQCTSVKDLIEKYENGTIFCSTEEKTGQIEETAATNSAAPSTTVEDTFEEESIPTDSDNSSSEQEGGEEDGEDPTLEKIIPTEPIVEIESILPIEEIKNDDSKNEISINETEIPTETEPLVENPKDDTSSEAEEPVEVFYKDDEVKNDEQPEENLNANEEQSSVTEILDTENEVVDSENHQILEEINSLETSKVIEPVQDQEKNEDDEETETKILENKEAEIIDEKEATVVPVPEKSEAEEEEEEEEDPSKKLSTESRVLLELESEWSSSPDDTNAAPPVLSETIDFVDDKESLFEKTEKKEEIEENVVEDTEKQIEQVESLPEPCAETPTSNEAENSEAEIVEKPSEYTAIEAELCLQNEALDSKMDENDLEEKSNEMIVEENDKIDEMEVDDSSTNSPMAQEEILEPMDDSDAGHS